MKQRPAMPRPNLLLVALQIVGWIVLAEIGVWDKEDAMRFIQMLLVLTVFCWCCFDRSDAQ